MKVNNLLYVANYDHLGIILWTDANLHRVLELTIKRLEEYPKYRTGWDHEAFAYDYLAENDQKHLRLMQEARAKYGKRIGLGTSTYGQPLSMYIGPESNVRQLVYAVRTVEKYFGDRPRVYIMSEHAFHAQMPQLLAGAGFDGAILRTHFMMYGVNPEISEGVVRWQGIDGTTVAAVPTYEGQACHGAINGFTIDGLTGDNLPFGFNTLDNKILTDSPLRYGKTMEDFRRRFFGIRPLVASRADDPRQPEGIISELCGENSVSWVSDDLFEVIGTEGPVFAPSADEFVGRMPWGICSNEIWDMTRSLECDLFAWETAGALSCMTSQENRTLAFEDCWKNLLVLQHHDIQICTLVGEARKFSGKARAVLDSAISEIGAVGDGVLFNPLHWERYDPDQNGHPYQIQGWGVRTAEINVADEGGMAWNESALMLKTEYYTVTFRTDGALDALTDAAGNDLLMRGMPNCTLAATVEGGGQVMSGTVAAEIGQHKAEITVTGAIGHLPSSLKLTFYAAHPRIDVNISVHLDGCKIGRASEDRRDPMSAFINGEKLRFRLYPAQGRRGRGFHDLPFDFTETERQEIEGVMLTGTAGTDGGIAIFNKGVMCLTREPDGALSVPLCFAMYYVWGGGNGAAAVVVDGDIQSGESDENPHPGYLFTAGERSWELAFLPFGGCPDRAGLLRDAMEFNIPCLAINRTFSTELDGIRLEADRGVFVSSAYVSGGDVFIRLYELEGRPSLAVLLDRNGDIIPAVETDLLENELTGQPGPMKLRPHGVHTWKLGLGGRRLNR